ncbi:MAG: hypothetical protein ACK5Q1_08795, partial [Limnobacter sp.]
SGVRWSPNRSDVARTDSYPAGGKELSKSRNSQDTASRFMALLTDVTENTNDLKDVQKNIGTKPLINPHKEYGRKEVKSSFQVEVKGLGAVEIEAADLGNVVVMKIIADKAEFSDRNVALLQRIVGAQLESIFDKPFEVEIAWR